MVPFRVWMPKMPDAPFEETLRAQLDERWELRVGERVVDCDVLVAGRPKPEQLGASVRSVVVPFAGIPVTTRELLLTRADITLHNLHHNSAPTAELAVGLMVAAAKRVIPADQALRRNDWTMRYDNHNGLLLAGRTAVIIGYGAIGRAIGASCRALGMEVVGMRRSAVPITSGEEAEQVFGAEALDELLPRADVLFLAVPATPESEGMIDARRLALLPQTAIVVNVARAAVIHEEALYDALRSQQIWGAGLDVWWHYPQSEEARGNTSPANCDFASLENVVLSPHRAGHSDRTEELRAMHLAQLLNGGDPGALGNQVDVSRGY